jgi:hypothetical protein
LSHVFRGSLSEDIANHAALPIMTVKIWYNDQKEMDPNLPTQ